MNSELYLKKYQYERLIKNLNKCYVKLEQCYSNLTSCKKNVKNLIEIDNNIYNLKEYVAIVSSISKTKSLIANSLLPEARRTYNNILFKISKI